MASMSRRNLLRAGAVGGLGLVVAGSVDAIVAPRAAAQVGGRSAGYGPLVPDPDGLLSLPEGFSYKIVAESGVTTLDSGEVTPGQPDGMACFRSGRNFVLVNNHEISDDDYGVPAVPGLVYDPGARGGTTTIVVDEHGGRIREYVSLAGTVDNCAGGTTPWGTWLTCEETEDRAGVTEDGLTLERDHGYVFEVDAFDHDANQEPVPLKFLGRYEHEAVAVDPRDSTIYLTEDADEPNGLYYRWTPPRGFRGGKGALRMLALGRGGDTAGRLQAMSCYHGHRHVADLSEATRPGTRYHVRWVDVPDRDATTESVRNQFGPGEVTRSRKLEGAYWRTAAPTSSPVTAVTTTAASTSTTVRCGSTTRPPRR